MLHKKQIKQAFNRAAASYDQSARLQNTVALDLLNHIEIFASNIVDIGCGTGFFTHHYAKKYPATTVLGVDFASDMLAQAQIKLPQNNIDWLCADAELLPIASNTVQIVASNLMLQWSGNLQKCFSEMQRILIPGGYLFFSTFAPGSLRELCTAWQQVDDKPRVHTFTPAQVLIDYCQQLNFSEINLSKKSYTFYYTDALTIMHDLKNIGASNRAANRSQGLTSAKKLRAVIAAYHTLFYSNQKLPISYEIYFGVMKK